MAPVAKPYRRILFALRAKLEGHLAELVAMDVTENVDRPTSWDSGVVIVPRTDGKICLCVDMRQANKAIVRQYLPVPTVDELLLDMNGAVVF